MKNIKKVKDQKKELASKDSETRDELKKMGAKEIVKCPELGVL